MQESDLDKAWGRAGGAQVAASGLLWWPLVAQPPRGIAVPRTNQRREPSVSFCYWTGSCLADALWRLGVVRWSLACTMHRAWPWPACCRHWTGTGLGNGQWQWARDSGLGYTILRAQVQAQAVPRSAAETMTATSKVGHKTGQHRRSDGMGPGSSPHIDP